MKNKAKEQGFTLIEQLIALALGALLMAGIATSVSAITRAQNLTQDYGNLHESLSFITSSLARSTRGAEKVNATSSNAQLSITINSNADRETQSCLAKKMQQNFTETYSLVDNNLVCEVEYATGGSTVNQSEVIAFGINSLSFDCAVFDENDKDKKVEFEPCEEVLLADVIAVRANLILDRNKFLEIKQDFEYSATTYLRAAHHKKSTK